MNGESCALPSVCASERFSRILVDTVGEEQLGTWVAVNRGALILCRSAS